MIIFTKKYRDWLVHCFSASLIVILNQGVTRVLIMLVSLLFLVFIIRQCQGDSTACIISLFDDEIKDVNAQVACFESFNDPTNIEESLKLNANTKLQHIMVSALAFIQDSAGRSLPSALKEDIQFQTSLLLVDDNCEKKLTPRVVDKDFLLSLLAYLSPQFMSAPRLAYPIFKQASTSYNALIPIIQDLNVIPKPVLSAVEKIVKKYTQDYGGSDLETTSKSISKLFNSLSEDEDSKEFSSANSDLSKCIIARELKIERSKTKGGLTVFEIIVLATGVYLSLVSILIIIYQLNRERFLNCWKLIRRK